MLDFETLDPDALPLDTIYPGAEVSPAAQSRHIQTNSPSTTSQNYLAPPTAPENGMTVEEYQGNIDAAISAACQFIDEDISPLREYSVKKYYSMPLGNEVEGRSRFVASDVRDSVLASLPNLMRIFCGTGLPVVFEPGDETQDEKAAQCTKFVNQICLIDNPGFLIFYECFKSALAYKTGVITWWHEEFTKTTAGTLSGVDELSMRAFMDNDEIEMLDIQPNEQSQDGIPLYKGSFKRHRTKNRYKIECIPPEEFIYAPRTKLATLDESPLVGRRQLKTRSQLIEMGVSAKILEEAASPSRNVSVDNPERQAREDAQIERILDGNTHSRADEPDASSETMEYVEVWICLDKDGDGVSERRKVCTVGPQHTIVYDEPSDLMAPFAVYSPDPEPFTMIGSSFADLVGDVQDNKTAIIRSFIDSLAMSINPRWMVEKGQVDLDDLLNTELGAPIRINRPGAATPVNIPFAGQPALEAIAYMDATKEQRTGVTRVSQGLDPNILQSTTKSAADAAVSGGQARAELIARVLAETGHIRLFRGLFQLIARYQNRDESRKIANSWITLSPADWQEELNCVPNVGLGSGSDESALQGLMFIQEMQKQALAALGMADNPLVSIKQVYNTYVEIIHRMGFRDANRFIKPVNDAMVKAYEEQQRNKPDMSPEILLAKIEEKKVNASIQKGDQDIAVQKAKLLLDDDRERDKNESDAYLKAMDLQFKYQQPLDLKILEDLINRDRIAQQLELGEAMDEQTAIQGEINPARQQTVEPVVPQGPSPDNTTQETPAPLPGAPHNSPLGQMVDK